MRVADFRLDIGAFEAQTAGPALLGDYNLDQSVDAGDYVMWRKLQGTTVTPWSGADGNGDGVVDQDDHSVWRAHFGQTLPPNAGSWASAAAEINLSSPKVSSEQQAVEVRGASENQWAKMARESAFVDLAAPPTRSRAEIRHILRTSSAATASVEDSRRNSALLSWLSKADSEPAPWPKGKMVEMDQTIDAGDSLRESIEEAFSLVFSGWTPASAIESTVW